MATTTKKCDDEAIQYISSGVEASLMNPAEQTSKVPSSRLFLYYVAALASIGGMLFGYDTGVISGALIQLQSNPDKWESVGGMDLSGFEQEMVVSIATAGAVIGSIASSITNRYYGRRLTIMGSSFFFILGALIMAFAPDVALLLVGRFVVGLSVGFASHTVPLYLAEVAPEDARGMLVTLNNVTIVIGQVLASVVDCGFGIGEVPQGWRYMLGLGAIPGALLLLGFIALPASPRWLVSKGRLPEASASLQLIRNATEMDINPELRRIATHITDADALPDSGNLKALWNARSALALGCGLQLLQQVAGINTLMYYSSTILASSSGTTEGTDPWSTRNNTAICLSAVTACAQLVGVVLGMFAVDRFGRRVLTLGSLALVVCSLVLLGFAFFEQQSQTMALLGMMVYLVAFGVGMSPMPWLVNAEIYPMHIRSMAISISTSVNWISNLIVSATFLSLAKATSTDHENPKDHPDMAFWIYAAMSVVGWIWLFFSMPETKGKTLEEVSRLFGIQDDESLRPLSFDSDDDNCRDDHTCKA